MAKHKKPPKLPKKSSSLKVWENYKRKLEDVKKHNAQVDKNKRDKEKLIEQTAKLRSNL